MAYGRLDVFWPDGKFDTYLLDSQTVSVGRSSGCTIVLDTDTISRYHFSITQNGDEIAVSDMDSANGTFVDGVRLGNNETRGLQGGEELQAGVLRMIFHRVSDQPTMPMEAISEETQRFDRADLGFRVEVFGPEIAVPPGSHTQIELSIDNTSDEAKRFTVEVSGLPEGWARVNRPELEIDADQGAPVLINVKPARRSDSTPGDYTATVTVALKDDPESKIEAAVPVRILPYTGLGMALGSRTVSGHEPFRLHLHNQGSIGLPLYIIGRSKDDVLRFHIPQQQVILAPGQRMVVQGTVRPQNRRVFGAARDQVFDVLVRSRDEAAFLAAIRAHYIDKAILPRWSAFGLAVLVVVLGVFVALALLLLLQAPPPEPAVVSFGANATQIAQGEPLELNWSVEDADHVNILVDNVPIQTQVPSETTSAQIDTAEYNGEIVVALQAFNNDQTNTALLTITVYEPLMVEYFEVMPSILVRNVVQQITVRWRVNGATRTWITGLENFGTVDPEPSYGPEGSFVEVPGIPAENFSITLHAEGAVENTLEEVINVDLLEPECTTIEASLTLYSAPDPTSNVVSTINDRGVVLVVNGRSENGQWLRVQVSGGVEAWGARTGLDCADIFNPDNLQIVVSETETPQATPQVPPSPTFQSATPTTTPTAGS